MAYKNVHPQTLEVVKTRAKFIGFEVLVGIPAAALGGGAFLLACDVIARLVPSRSEMPLGVVTGLIGAPLFLLLLIRLRRERAYA